MSISERIAALPKKPEYIYDYGAQDEELAYYRARLSLLSDAVSAYLNAVDAYRAYFDEQGVDSEDEAYMNGLEKLIETKRAAESDLREVYRALA